ncbi:MAG: alpha-galactosidase [Clostridia bacterium]|nr:alpha-galactosidase [Clostridia bacterium]
MKKLTLLREFIFGDMLAQFWTDEEGRVGLTFVPAALAGKADPAAHELEPLIQLYLRGDPLPGGYANGLTTSGASSSYGMKFAGQTVTEEAGLTVVETRLRDERGRSVRHILNYWDGDRAFAVRSIFENDSDAPVVLESLSSFSVGGLTPFGDTRATDRMILHRARSWWSGEGKIESGSLVDYHLEPSWSRHGARCEKFFQIGSMPVRHYFPFLAAEDREAGVTWAAQIACPSSWQMEARRQRDELCLTGGLADYETGHWSKTVKPGERFETPSAYLTVGEGGLDPVSQRLQDLHRGPGTRKDEPLAVLFNEYCTTWGNPTEENVKKCVDALKGHGIDTFVIDAGWYGKKEWWASVGDWDVSEAKFPNGIRKAAEIIREAGMRPGIWFEMENATSGSEVAKAHPDWMLHRNGFPVNTGRMFFDFRRPEVRDYLRERVIRFLGDNGFGYLKIDYNDTIGLGCDELVGESAPAGDGLGEGLRQNQLASQDFWRAIRREVPGIQIENCASGGHRLEPSMMALSDYASFSDAHECVHIPVIAAHLHRLIRPEQSQIWAVLRKTDSIRRINYSLVNTLLGVMCLSGDIFDLSPEQWEAADRAIAFYRKVSPIIRNGESSFFGEGVESFAHPAGWQTIACRDRKTGKTLVVLHTFEGPLPERVTIPVKAGRIDDVLSTEGNEIRLTEDGLVIELRANFEAVAVSLSE